MDEIHRVFLEVLAGETTSMDIWILIDRETGEEYQLPGNEVERITKVELGYLQWVIQQDGVFENGNWRIAPAERNTEKEH